MSKVQITGVQIERIATAFKAMDDGAGINKGMAGALDRLNALPGAQPDSIISRAEVLAPTQVSGLPTLPARDLFDQGKVPLLYANEQKAAALLLDIMGDPELQPAPPPIPATPTLSFPPRQTNLTLDEAKEQLKRVLVKDSRFPMDPEGKVYVPNTFQINPAAHELSSMIANTNNVTPVNLFSVLDRVAGTRRGTDDSNPTNITPDLLQVRQTGIYPGDGVYAEAAKLLKDPEQSAAQFLYAVLFVPPAQYGQPEKLHTLLAAVSDEQGNTVLELSTNWTRATSPDYSRLGQATVQIAIESITLKGAPGTVVFYGQGRNNKTPPDYEAELNQSAIIPPSGEITIPAISPIVGSVMIDPDGTGVLSPKVVGRFAQTLPQGLTTAAPLPPRP